MALVVSRVGGAAAGPFPTSLSGMWWARAKLSFTAGSTAPNTGLQIGNEFKNVFGFSRLAFVLPDAVGGDVGFATAQGVCSSALLVFNRNLNRLLFFGIGRAVDGAGGVLVPSQSLGNNLTSIDAMTFLVQVWGFM